MKTSCEIVLFADNANYNGVFTITAIPLKDTNTGAITTDSIRIKYGSTSYLVDKNGLRVEILIIKLFILVERKL